MGSSGSEGRRWPDMVKDIVVDPAMACTDVNSFLGKCGNNPFSGEVTKAACVPFRKGAFSLQMNPLLGPVTGLLQYEPICMASLPNSLNT
jgi:hypothetical protein